jgi:DNA-binding MarR family transcriptional regulator
MLDKLEQRALIVRERPADNRRTVRIGVTENGLALLDEIAGPLRKCHGRQLGHLSPEDLKRLGALLRAARGPHEDLEGAWR